MTTTNSFAKMEFEHVAPDGRRVSIQLVGPNPTDLHEIYLRLQAALNPSPPPLPTVQVPYFTTTPRQDDNPAGQNTDPTPPPLNGDPIPAAGFTATGTVPPAPAPSTVAQPGVIHTPHKAVTEPEKPAEPVKAATPAEPPKDDFDVGDTPAPVAPKIDLGASARGAVKAAGTTARKPRKVNSTKVLDFQNEMRQSYGIMLDNDSIWGVVRQRWAELTENGSPVPQTLKDVLAKDWTAVKNAVPKLLDDMRRASRDGIVVPVEAVTDSTGGSLGTASTEIDEFMTPAAPRLAAAADDGGDDDPYAIGG